MKKIMVKPKVLEDRQNAQEENLEQQKERIFAKELHFQNILAEKYDKYGAKDKFIYSLYNDLLKNFVIELDGYLLPKKFITSHICNNKICGIFNNKNENEGTSLEDITETKFDENNDLIRDKTNKLYLRSSLKEEHIHFYFLNNNSYCGCTSRKMMNGEGLYKWHHGIQYKGQFKENQIQGRGLLEWQSNCWYEGEFMKGYRHGKGTLVDKDHYRLYIGQWHMGYRHGKGYCCYADGDSYDGEWSMGKRNGIGFYVYSSGARYKGHWKNDFRHGNGIMAWPNGDVYHGEWECGDIHGYGEYIWHGFCNKNFCWPQSILYFGNWYHSTKHGKGLLKLNSMGGVKYFGYWKYNKKHGYGIIIGNNGELMEGQPLYSKDILTSSHANKISNILKPRTATVLRPEQFPSLSYHINRLIKLSSMTNFSVCSRSLGKCYVCKQQQQQQSCSCLLQFSFQTRYEPNIRINSIDIKWQSEQNQIYDYLTMHMLQIRHVYDIYAKLFNKEESNCKCHFVMIKLTLWQLWRDCNINNKGFSLIEIDNYLAENESSFITKPYYPFEQIEIWQFLHALLEVSWRIYYWKDNQIKLKKQWEHGVIAKCLNEFLTHDVYPNAGNFIGVIPREFNILLPINSIYKLYKQIGYPPTATDLLIASVRNRKIGANVPSITQTTLIMPEYIFNGLNCVIIGERIHFLSRGDKSFLQTNYKMQKIDKWLSNDTRELFLFQELGPTKIVQIMTKVCPSIKNNDNQTILNMNYLLTFLEFYEIILQAAKCIVKLRKNENVST
ncbi:PREDICTED: radial spoke head 10 homolog B-like isoform X2 [Polistes dominula]|uniref:Radial spoke head 10 homolog B-like isoform X2 n=1 Tax=Polistes dominula TaxID=743375 RepID=A0ABM1J017_POLDO|nr:PREDICTED: radial spoke head 10 homolog B-like isoform X2 [Polistes dominula]